MAGNGKEFIKNLSKYDSNKERLGGNRVLRPVDMTDGMMFIYDSTADAFHAIIMPQGADVLFKDERPICLDNEGVLYILSNDKSTWLTVETGIKETFTYLFNSELW